MIRMVQLLTAAATMLMVSSVVAQPAGTTSPAAALAASPSAAAPVSRLAGSTAAPRTLFQLEDDVTSGPIAVGAGTYAVFHTSDGDFIVHLFTDKAPNTTRNFVELATGKKAWKHPVTMVDSTKPIYNNTLIYKIIEDSMIFGGDPINKGAGDSGILQTLETSPDLQFNQSGLLAMDGNGSQSSGSRWFIALRPYPDRNGRYTIIGKVIGGIDVVRAISNKPTKKPQVPLDPTLLSSIEILEIPPSRKTTATFAAEDGRKVLSVDPNFQTVEEPKPAETDELTTAVDTATTATATETTTTVSQ